MRGSPVRRTRALVSIMSERVKPKFFWFRITIAFGLLLGLLLLVQTVGTYRYVSQSLVRQEELGAETVN